MLKIVYLTIIISVCAIVLGNYVMSRLGNKNSDTTYTVTTKTFQSTKLGLRFTYAERDDLGHIIRVQESGDTIYVYPENTSPQNGQFVRVFSKTANETLKQAVEARFLINTNPEDCYVNSGTDANGTKPTSGKAVIITYPIINDANNTWLVNSKKCPVGYSLSDGLSYFWTEKESRDKFVFYNIGQYLIPATTVGTSWHVTLKFIP